MTMSTQKQSKKVAFITGGNRGIGLDTAKALGAQGYALVLGVRDLDKATDALTVLRGADYQAEAVVYDADDKATDAAVAAYFDKTWGRLDVLVNNAGILLEGLGGNSTVDGSEDDLEATFAVNFFAVTRLTRALLPLVRKAEAGRIVNVSSILGSLSLHADPKSPIAGSKAFAYNASKAALNAFTIHLADALKDTPIKVNAIHPGWVQTPLGGAGAPEPVDGSGRASAKLATVGADGPHGGFFTADGPLPW